MSFPISAPPSEPQIRGHFYWALKGTLSLGFNTSKRPRSYDPVGPNRGRADRGILAFVRALSTTKKWELARQFSCAVQAREQPKIVVVRARKYCTIDVDTFRTHSVRVDQAGMQRVCALFPGERRLSWGKTCIYVTGLPRERAFAFVCALQRWAFRKLTVADLTEFEIAFYERNTRDGLGRGLEMFEDDPPHQTEPSPPLWIPTVCTAPGDSGMSVIPKT